MQVSEWPSHAPRAERPAGGFASRTRPNRLLVRLLPCALAVILAAGGCAYSFRGTNLPAHIKTVAIPNFDNETLEPNLDQEVTTAVIERFIRDGRLKIAPEGQADARLEGKIIKYENKVYNYQADQSPRDYIVVLTVALSLRDQVKNRDLWKDDGMTRTAVHVPGGQTPALTTEEEARREAIDTLARDLVSRTLEQW